MKKCKFPRGSVLYWLVFDPDTGEPAMKCKSRSEARRIASQCNAKIARVVVSD